MISRETVYFNDMWFVIIAPLRQAMQHRWVENDGGPHHSGSSVAAQG
jgi:hypothetical protein